MPSGVSSCPLYYLACGEVLAREIAKRGTIQGIKLNDLEHILEQFADDTEFFTKTHKDVLEVIKVLHVVETNIGLKVNYDKSSIHCVAGAKPFH